MARPKSLPDAEVLATARQLHLAGGDRGLSFGTLARATGLAASTLAQRFGSVEGLMAAAARAGWHAQEDAREAAEARTADKGPQGFLRALEPGLPEILDLITMGRSDEEARRLAGDWRIRVETALAQRIGQGEKAKVAARALFAAWQGQALWSGPEGVADLRIKDLAKKLA